VSRTTHTSHVHAFSHLHRVRLERLEQCEAFYEAALDSERVSRAAEVAGLRGDLAAAAERATMAQEESWQRLHSALTQLDAQRLSLQQQFDLERAAMERAHKSELIGLRNDIVDLQSHVEDGKRDKDCHNDRVRDLEEEMAAITRQRHDALQACHAEVAARQLCEEEKAALERQGCGAPHAGPGGREGQAHQA